MLLVLMVVEGKMGKVFYLLLPVVILAMNSYTSTHEFLSEWGPRAVWDGTISCFLLKDYG